MENFEETLPEAPNGSSAPPTLRLDSSGRLIRVAGLRGVSGIAGIGRAAAREFVALGVLHPHRVPIEAVLAHGSGERGHPGPEPSHNSAENIKR